MRILFLTAQSFHPEGRKASTHFLASGLHQLGHEVYVLTVGVSLARMALAPHRNKGALSYLSWKHDPDGLWKRTHIDIVHRPARYWKFVSGLLERLRSDTIPRSVLRDVGDLDAIIIASGLAVAYYDFLRSFYPSARILYNAADSLSGVGYSGKIIAQESRALLGADAVRTPSTLLADEFPVGTNWHLVPHGVDKKILLDELPSPYPDGSINAVMVGSTLLDWDALIDISKAVPDVKIHVFGVSERPDLPKNLILHGEVAFHRLAPYMQHASIALAPYKLSKKNAYIAESSLKIRQYRACGLPIVCPETLFISGNDVFNYNPSDNISIKRSLASSLKRGRKTYEGYLPDWEDVSKDIEVLLQG